MRSRFCSVLRQCFVCFKNLCAVRRLRQRSVTLCRPAAPRYIATPVPSLRAMAGQQPKLSDHWTLGLMADKYARAVISSLSQVVDKQPMTDVHNRRQPSSAVYLK